MKMPQKLQKLQTLKRLMSRKFARAIAIYALSLVAAVACGENFQVKRPKEAAVGGKNSPLSSTSNMNGSLPSDTNGGTPNSEFAPVMVQAIKQTSDSAGSTLNHLAFQFRDNQQWVALASLHYGGDDQEAVTEIAGNKYYLYSACIDAECTEIGVIVARVAASTNQVNQSGFMLRQINGSMNLTTMWSMHGTHFDDANEAYYGVLSDFRMRNGE